MARGSDGGETPRRTVLKKGALFAGGLAGATGTAAAQTPITDCTVIDEPGEYVLENDVSHAGRGSCIVILARDVTLDGDGHVVSGDGSGTGLAISSSDPLGNATVRDVTVTGFATGVEVVDFDGNPVVLDRCRVVDNGTGIDNGFLVDLTVRNSSIDDNDGPGIDSGSRGAVTVVGSTMDGNGGTAITAPGDDQAVTVANSTVRNNANGVVAEPIFGNSAVTDSVVAGNDGFGVALTGTLFVRGGTVPVVRNEIRDNGGPGVDVRFGTAVVHENDLENNGHGVVVHTTGDPSYFDPSAEVDRNNIVGNDGFGVLNERAGTVTIPATCNYWGHATGPRHEDNPRKKPKGDRVSDGVEFIPWSVRRIRDGEGTCVGGRGGGPEDDDDGRGGGGGRGGGH